MDARVPNRRDHPMSNDTLTPVDLVDDTDETALADCSRNDRGMVTAEYIVGIIAAISLALVLLQVFKANSFLKTITDIIGGLFKMIFGFFS